MVLKLCWESRLGCVESTSHLKSLRNLTNILTFVFLYPCLPVFFNRISESGRDFLTLVIKMYLKKKIWQQHWSVRNFRVSINAAIVSFLSIDSVLTCKLLFQDNRETTGLFPFQININMWPTKLIQTGNTRYLGTPDF